jgi:hypothetical protein
LKYSQSNHGVKGGDYKITNIFDGISGIPGWRWSTQFRTTTQQAQALRRNTVDKAGGKQEEIERPILLLDIDGVINIPSVYPDMCVHWECYEPKTIRNLSAIHILQLIHWHIAATRHYLMNPIKML